MSDHDPQKDFDFLIGTWEVHNRKLKERLKGSTYWEAFKAAVVVRPIWGGLANVDEYQAETPVWPNPGNDGASV